MCIIKKPTLIWSAQLEIMNLTQREFIKIEQIIHISIVNIYVKNFFPAKSSKTCRLNLVKDAGKNFLWNFKVSHFLFSKIRAICKRMTHIFHFHGGFQLYRRTFKRYFFSFYRNANLPLMTGSTDINIWYVVFHI